MRLYDRTEAGAGTSLLQELKKQRTHRLRLFLLHPVASTRQEMDAAHLRAGRRLHEFQPPHALRSLVSCDPLEAQRLAAETALRFQSGRTVPGGPALRTTDSSPR